MRRGYTMRKQTAYCQMCDEDVEYTANESTRNATIRGINYDYPYLEAICIHCGEEVYPPEIGKTNMIALFDGYKKKMGLLTSQEIKEIRERYGLSQKQLSELIGCGLKTITRYENGAIQDRVFDNFIRLIDKGILSKGYSYQDVKDMTTK